MKIKVLMAAVAALLIFPAFGVIAYAGGGPEADEAAEAPVVETEAEPNPFTPEGTGTVLDNATDEDGKEFYTIMTPSENVFYLVIDRQRETENVYFLNAVTEQDLMALAEVSGDTEENGTGTTPDPTPAPEPAPEPEPEPTPEPETGGNMTMAVVVVLFVLAGGGAAYYFKIYRPKQEQGESLEDYDDYSEYEAEAEESEDDTPPWYEDGEEPGGGDGE